MQVWAVFSLAATIAFARSPVQNRDLHAESDEPGELERPRAKDSLDATSVTTIWIKAVVDFTTTYKPFTVTQTFGRFPDQRPAPLSGEIDHGMLKTRRDVVPTSGSDASVRTNIPIVLEGESVGITEYIQPFVTITEIHYEAVWTPENSTDSANSTLGNQTMSDNVMASPSLRPQIE